MAKVYLEHPETGGRALVDDEPGVVTVYESKGWKASTDIPDDLNPDAPNSGAIKPLPVPDEKPVKKAAAKKAVSQNDDEKQDGE